MPITSTVWALPVLVWQTGYFDNHTPKESLDIADFLKSGEMVERLIWEYANQNK